MLLFISVKTIDAEDCHGGATVATGGDLTEVTGKNPACSRQVLLKVTCSDAATEPVFTFYDKDDTLMFTVLLGTAANTKHSVDVDGGTAATEAAGAITL